MLSVSEEEYKQMKQELSEIRLSISRYVGYIVSIAGVAPLLSKLLTSSLNFAAVTAVTIIVSIFVITLLFDMVWYKFISHNRYVGYIQLISQETGYHNLKDSDRLSISPGAYHFERERNAVVTGRSSIFGWEYVMSRYNNSKKKDSSRGASIEALIETHYDFKIPDKYFKYKKKIYDLNVEYKYLNNIIARIYRRTEKRIFRFSLINSWKSFVYLYYESKDYKLRFVDTDISGNHIINGWAYPRKLLQITFISINLLLLYLLATIGKADFSLFGGQYIFFNDYPYLLWIFAFCTTQYFWFWKYVNRLHFITNGYNSIEYYCWSFFLFRIQLLNSVGLIPVYSSRSFIRYFKSQIYRLKLKNGSIFNEVKLSSFNCFSCSKKVSNYSFKITAYKIQLSKQRGKLLCKRCFDRYESSLIKGNDFSYTGRIFHSIIKDTIK